MLYCPLTGLPVVNDGIHRPNAGTCDTCTETHEDGREYAVPKRLWCRAPALILKDESLRWVSEEEARRLEELLRPFCDDALDEWWAGARENPLDIPGVLEIVIREGYTKIGVAYASPADGVEQYHYLVRDQHGAHVVISPELWDEDGVYLHHIDTSVGDKDFDCRIVRLELESDIQLARRYGLLCLDADGPHVQVYVWRSVIWQCTDENAQIDSERLRKFWRQAVGR